MPKMSPRCSGTPDAKTLRGSQHFADKSGSSIGLPLLSWFAASEHLNCKTGSDKKSPGFETGA